MFYDDLVADIRACIESACPIECASPTSVGLLSALDHYVQNYGIDAVCAIFVIIKQANSKAHIIAVVCAWLGNLNHPASYQMRLSLFELRLWHESVWMRHGAILGLQGMADYHACPYLRAALAREPIRVLRDTIQAILDDLAQPYLCEQAITIPASHKRCSDAPQG